LLLLLLNLRLKLMHGVLLLVLLRLLVLLLILRLVLLRVLLLRILLLGVLLLRILLLLLLLLRLLVILSGHLACILDLALLLLGIHGCLATVVLRVYGHLGPKDLDGAVVSPDSNHVLALGAVVLGVFEPAGEAGHAGEADAEEAEDGADDAGEQLALRT
jgi:hypothetical protein